MNKRSGFPFTCRKVHTLPMLEYVGQLPPSADVVSADPAGGSFSIRCRFSRAVHLVSTRFADGSFRFIPRPTLRCSHRWPQHEYEGQLPHFTIKGIYSTEGQILHFISNRSVPRFAEDSFNFRRQGVNTGPVTPFTCEEIHTPPLLEYAGQLALPHVPLVPTSREAHLLSQDDSVVAALLPIHAPRKAHSGADPDA